MSEFSVPLNTLYVISETSLSRLEICSLLLNVQGKDVSYLKQPAAGLVRLALDRWQLRGMRADNISAIVILLNSRDSVNQSAAPTTARCRDTCRPTKDILRRVRLRRQRCLGLRTVLGKICRLRAQQKLSSVCVVRSPLASYNTMSALLQQQQEGGADVRTTAGDELPLRRPLRRRSYQEACSDADDAEKITMRRRRLGVVVRRLSVDVARNYMNLSEDVNGDVSCGGLESDRDEVPSDDGRTVEGSMVRASETTSAWSEATSVPSEPMHLLDTAADTGTEDVSCGTSHWRSSISLCSLTDIECVSA